MEFGILLFVSLRGEKLQFQSFLMVIEHRNIKHIQHYNISPLAQSGAAADALLVVLKNEHLEYGPV